MNVENKDVIELFMSTNTLFPRLLGDVGGTNARFGWQSHGGGVLERIHVLPCADYADIALAIEAYLLRAGVSAPAAACIGIANPVTGDHISMTNHHWSFSICELQQRLSLQKLKVINDFTALAMSIPDIPKDQLIQICGGKAAPDAAIALIGAGTGLGVSGLMPSDDKCNWVPISGEGGHSTLAVQSLIEFQVIEIIRRRYGHVSGERVLSGQGLTDLYSALCELKSLPLHEPLSPADISKLALMKRDPLAIEALDLFAGFLGSLAGNLALTLGARGGVYLGGGIVPHWLGWFEQSSFKSRFIAKGRFENYLRKIPVWVINAPHSPALWGAARSLLTSS